MWDCIKHMGRQTEIYKSLRWSKSGPLCRLPRYEVSPEIAPLVDFPNLNFHFIFIQAFSPALEGQYLLHWPLNFGTTLILTVLTCYLYFLIYIRGSHDCGNSNFNFELCSVVSKFLLLFQTCIFMIMQFLNIHGESKPNHFQSGLNQNFFFITFENKKKQIVSFFMQYAKKS